MALCLSEGTTAEVMSYFALPGGGVAGYVLIEEAPINHFHDTVALKLRKYASQVARDSSPDCGVVEVVAFRLPASALAAMQSCHPYDVLYPYLQACALHLLGSPNLQALCEAIGVENIWA